MVKAILTKPLDGEPEGTEREFSKTDFDRLKRLNAVRAAGEPETKAAPPLKNKMAPAAYNKVDVAPRTAGSTDPVLPS